MPSTTLPTAYPKSKSPPSLVGSLSLARLSRLAVPAILASLCSTLFSTANAYWIGHLLGPDALAASTISFFWLWSILSVSEIIGTGLLSLSSRYHGAECPDKAALLSGQATILALALGLLIAFIFPPILPNLLAHMHLAPPTITFAISYLSVILYGSPVLSLVVVLDALLMASGDNKTPLYLTLVALIFTIFLDPLLIQGIGIIPALGIKGAAFSTIATQAIATLGGYVYAYRRGLIRFSLPTMANIRSMTSIGLPSALTGLFVALSYIFLTRILAPFGTPALAAMGIGDQVEAWLFMVSLGLGEVVAAVVGQNIGAGNLDGARQATRTALKVALSLGVVVCLLEFTMAPIFVGYFTHNLAVIQESVHYLRLTCLAQLFFCTEIVLDEALSGAGYTFWPSLTSTSITALRLPLSVLAATLFGLTGIWLVITTTTIIRALVLFYIWRSDKWATHSDIASITPSLAPIQTGSLLAA